MARRRWEDLKREHLEGFNSAERAEFNAGYESARLAFKIGAEVRTIREARGMSQKDLAGRAGTSQSAIARLEAGGVEPKLETLTRIGNALGASLTLRIEAKETVLPGSS